MLTVREYACRIVRIVDGDTVVVDIDYGHDLWRHNQPLRLRGIDAAETNDPDPRLRVLAKYQRDFIATKLEVGKLYRFKSYKTKRGDERDKYGRYVVEFDELATMKAVRYNGSMSRELLRNEQIVLYDILVECGTIEAVK
jgi:endonuclease YncB( thermonuclease family)